MSLTVNWRWNMPTVGDPNKVAQTNADYLNSGLGAIAEGLIKRGENRRADEKMQWLKDKDARDFSAQQAQQIKDNLFKERQLKMLEDKAAEELERNKWLDEWTQKMLANQGLLLGDEKERRLAELEKMFGQNSPSDAQMVLMGLNQTLR